LASVASARTVTHPEAADYAVFAAIAACLRQLSASAEYCTHTARRRIEPCRGRADWRKSAPITASLPIRLPHAITTSWAGQFRPHTRRMTMSKIALALAFAMAVIYAVPASAAPTTCGHSTMQYDSSGTWTGPYCD
jgi:hypothetical protein